MPFVPELLKYKNNFFIETGTYQGDTIQYVYSSNIFQHIYSLELSSVFYYNCVNRFKGIDSIKLYKANSKTDLYQIIKEINEPITFWLDGHWSGVPYVGCDKDVKCPVIFELSQIQMHPIKNHTIIIDDMRLMDGEHFEATVQEIEQKLLEINPNYKFSYYDDYTSPKDVIVASL